MPRHSRPKDGVASLAYGRGIQSSAEHWIARLRGRWRPVL